MAEAPSASRSGAPPPAGQPEPASGSVARVQGFPAPSGPIDLALHRGDVLLLEGPNGSGKTSLLRALAGLPSSLRPLSVQVQGSDPALLAARDLASTVHLALQDPRDTLVGLTVAGEFRLRRLPAPLEAKPLRERDVATLSSGEARQVSLAVTSSRSVPLLLLDEPAEGLDAAAKEALLSLVRKAAETGAVVAADHTGLLSKAATRTLRLAHEHPSAALQISAGAGAPFLLVPPQPIVRGDRAIHLPGIHLGPGFHALAGPNGAGKSTFLLACAGLLPGQAILGDELPWPGVNARLLLPRARDLFTAATVAEELQGADNWARRFVPAALLHRHPLTLSAGEAQRLALAKTLGSPARLFLLDEPEAHLDAEGRALLADAITRRVGEGSCVLAATHDPVFLAQAQGVTHVGEGPNREPQGTPQEPEGVPAGGAA